MNSSHAKPNNSVLHHLATAYAKLLRRAPSIAFVDETGQVRSGPNLDGVDKFDRARHLGEDRR